MIGRRGWTAMAAIALAAAAPAAALGPLDIELQVNWWEAESDVDGAVEDSGAPGGRVDLWFGNRVGASAGYAQTEPGGFLEGEELVYSNLDLKFRLFNVADNGYLAVGGGWQKVDLFDETTDGPRASVDGRVGFVGVLYGYARGAYYFGLGDIESDDGDVEVDDGWEAEAGLALHPLPFLWFYGGWRKNSVEFTGDFGPTRVQNEGWVGGIGVTF